MSMKNSNDTIENRTRDLPICNAVPQTTALVMNITYLESESTNKTIAGLIQVILQTIRLEQITVRDMSFKDVRTVTLQRGEAPLCILLRVFGQPLVAIEGCCFKADSHIACRAHAVPLPCRAAKGLECVFPI
jgi:hypothetical protein